VEDSLLPASSNSLAKLERLFEIVPKQQ